ncbi:hypothetical protein B0H13DRAFT_2336090 [Mycena leptocephala]|nr:hypothetical protein B0H13DRAFT_2336090 [Mycena leptocephala]
MPSILLRYIISRPSNFSKIWPLMSQSMCRLVVIMESEAEGRGSRKRALETASEATYGGAWVYALSTPILDSWYRDRRAVATSFRLFSPLLPRPLAAPLADNGVTFAFPKLGIHEAECLQAH